jgi:hypothetical protein
MSEHYCEAGVRRTEDGFETCDKVARFLCLGWKWLCADHWDSYLKELDEEEL